jgi:hypothetical protein
MVLMQILEDLARTRAETEPYFDLGETDLDKTYGPGKWTVREILHHLADAETVLYDRIRRIISEPKTVIWAFNQDLWSTNLSYLSLPLDASKAVYSSVRRMIILQAELHYKPHGSLEFIHSETGLRTLKDEFDKVVLHNDNHLAQMRKALA